MGRRDQAPVAPGVTLPESGHTEWNPTLEVGVWRTVLQQGRLVSASWHTRLKRDSSRHRFMLTSAGFRAALPSSTGVPTAAVSSGNLPKREQRKPNVNEGPPSSTQSSKEKRAPTFLVEPAFPCAPAEQSWGSWWGAQPVLGSRERPCRARSSACRFSRFSCLFFCTEAAYRSEAEADCWLGLEEPLLWSEGHSKNKDSTWSMFKSVKYVCTCVCSTRIFLLPVSALS